MFLPDDGSSTPIHTTRTHKPHGTPRQRFDPTYFWKRKKKRATKRKNKQLFTEQNRTERLRQNSVECINGGLSGCSNWSVKDVELPFSLMFELGTWQGGNGHLSGHLLFKRTQTWDLLFKLGTGAMFSHELGVGHQKLLALAFTLCTFPK